MKRTRQRFDRPEQETPSYVSGLRQFEGEDLQFHGRQHEFAHVQADWIAQQKRETN